MSKSNHNIIEVQKQKKCNYDIQNTSCWLKNVEKYSCEAVTGKYTSKLIIDVSNLNRGICLCYLDYIRLLY